MSGPERASPRLQVHFAQPLASELTPETIETLTQYIQDWKPAETSHWFFGRDVRNKKTAAHPDPLVWHAHLYPEVDEERAREWDDAWDAAIAVQKKGRSRSYGRTNNQLGPRPYERTSNHLMYYSMNVEHPHQHGLLVIEIVAEPDGHKPLYSSALLDFYEKIAFNHQVLGKIPK